MQGFKSFADTIELDFSEGITAIVGPNGSGKSNISDAVRWVLGEQSAKTLRGSKMEDVIFNGTQTRKRLGFAEVTLKLDNSDRHFGLDFDDVTVTRKVFASGEGQYFINDTPCRLKDIHEIFMDTGLGRDGYSMIGQGKIDEILSSKSEDRREIFEEAAGISKYRYRKEEAERRLRHTDENLDRVEDIIGELSVQLGPLTQQAEKAKKYLNLRDRLKIYDVNAVLKTVEKSQSQTAVLQEKMEGVWAQLTAVEAELTAADEAQEACYSRFESYAQTVAQKAEALKKAEENVILSQREIEVLKNTIEGNFRLLERIEKEAATLLTDKQGYLDAMVQEEKSLQDLDALYKTLEEEKQALVQSLSQFDEGVVDHSDKIESLKQAITKGFEQVSECKISLSNITLLENSLGDKILELKKTLSARKEEQQEQEKKSGSLDTEYKEKTEKISALEKEIEVFNQEEEGYQQTLSQQTEALNQLLATLNSQKTRYHVLSDMEQNFDGYYKSVKEVMQEHEKGSLSSKKIYGPVTKLISVPREYETAISIALGGSLQNIVVETEEDAKACINYLKTVKAGRATFMPLTAVSGSLMDVSKLQNEAGFIGIASELCQFDAKFSGIIRNLLGKTCVVKTLDQAIAISRKYKQTVRIVTQDGEIFYPGGSLAGGSPQKSNQLLGREQEIKGLEKSLAQLSKEQEKLEREKNKTEACILDITCQKEEIVLSLREEQEALLLLERDKEHHGTLMETLSLSILDLEEEIKSSEGKTGTFAEQRAQAQAKLEEAEEIIRVKREEVNVLEEEQATFLNRKQKINDQILEKGFQQQTCFSDMDKAREAIDALKQDLLQADTHIKLRHDEMQEIQKSNEGHRQEIAVKEEKNALLNGEIKAINEEIDAINKERQESEKELRTLQGDAKNTREIVYQLKTQYTKLETQKAKYEAESEAAITHLWDDYELTFSEAETMREELGSEGEMQKQISSLRAKIRELGNVNIDAIEELQAVSARYEFLTGQRDDLQKSKKDLLKIIDEMQTVMKKQFKEEFSKINRHFGTTFTELFGGGKAELLLEDEEDVLSCGIQINVQPPGKKLQSLSLLSGGERALSAIALLFAILRIKPTPFCFLDEIEAALDENNVYRYAEFIKRFSRSTQFILVTHRRGTMECADVIYGVTMQERGISKLLQLNFDEING